MTGEDLFWDLAEPLYADPAVSRSTMMGLPCLRYDGRFFASLDRTTQALLVKLPRARVAQLIADGRGAPFAPAGRTFREWVAITRPDRRGWRALIEEARAFAADADHADTAATGPAATAGPAATTQGPGSGAGFDGFGEAGFAFLAALERDNSKAVFDAHRDVYRRDLLEPSKAFVVALGRLLQQRVSPNLHAEPRVGASLFRLANDMRFAPDKPPYKTHVDAAFWEGDGKPRTEPALVLRLTATEVHLGAGAYALTGPALDRYRSALANPRSAARLDQIVDALVSSGADLSEATRKRVPAGVDPTGPAARFAVRDGFHVTHRHPRPAAATTADFVEWCADRLNPYTALHRWFVQSLTG